MRTIAEIYMQTKVFRYYDEEGAPRRKTIYPEDLSPEEAKAVLDHRLLLLDKQYKAYFYANIDKARAERLGFDNSLELIETQYKWPI